MANIINATLSPNNQQSILTALEKSRWFAALQQSHQERVLRSLVVRTFASEAYVVRKGEPVNAWVGVIDGLVKINAGNSQGKSSTFAGVPVGGWLGEGSMLKEERRKYDVVALRPSRVAFLPKKDFTFLLDESIPFNRFLLTQLNERLGQFIGMLESERLLGSDARVARCVAAMFNPELYPTNSDILSITQEEIGYLSGLSRQRTNLALQNLESLGLIRVKYRAIQILDLPGLHTVT